ncbi:chemotaxis-specific protein-glutamate methyltransferase CheB [bacterium]|nr:chemotaxis-specific protein-glutamate methyltransferase CheB [bacterium]
MAGKIRVLVVDDSALVRQILAKGLAGDPRIEVVGTASDPYVARDMIVKHRPDVLTLDVEMPRMDGVEFLRRLMPQHPLPVLMVSALTENGKQITMEALEAGAIDFVTKPSADVARTLNEMIVELRGKVRAVARADVSHWKHKKAPPKPRQSTAALAESTDKVIAIGASTGGTEAIRRVLQRFPASMPGVVIVQHMPAGFTKMFADRLNQQCAMEVKEAAEGDRIMQGRALIAPGDYHMRVFRSGGMYRVKLDQEEKVCGHRPSVEVLMYSVAKYVGANAVGMILTGMGNDGSKGILALREAGGRTMAQDEASSVVFGMPKEAYATGGAEKLVPLDRIADEVIRLFTRNP